MSHFSLPSAYESIHDAINIYYNSNLLVGADEEINFSKMQISTVLKTISGTGINVKDLVNKARMDWMARDGNAILGEAIVADIRSTKVDLNNVVNLNFVSTNRLDTDSFVDENFISAYPEFVINIKRNIGHPHGVAANGRVLEHRLLLLKCGYSKLKMSNDRRWTYLYCEIGANPLHLLSLPNIHGCIGLVGLRDTTRLTRFANELDDMNGNLELSDADRKRNADIIANKCTQFCYGKAQDCKVTAKYLIFLHSTYDMTLDDILSIMYKKRSQVAHVCMIFDETILVKDEGEIKGLGIYFKKFWHKHLLRSVRYIQFSFIGDSSISYIHRWDTYLSLLTRTYVSYSGSHFEIHKSDHRLNTLFIEVIRCTSFKPIQFIDEIAHFRFDCFSNQKKVLKWYDLDLDMTKKAGYVLKEKKMVISTILYDLIYNFFMKTEKSSFAVIHGVKAASSYNNRTTFNGVDMMVPDYQLSAAELFEAVYVIYLLVYRDKNTNGIILETLINDEKMITNLVKSNVIKRLFDCFKHTWTGERVFMDRVTSLLRVFRFMNVNKKRSSVGLMDMVDVVDFHQYIKSILILDPPLEVGVTQVLDIHKEFTVTVPYIEDILEAVRQSDPKVMDYFSNVKNRKVTLHTH